MELSSVDRERTLANLQCSDSICRLNLLKIIIKRSDNEVFGQQKRRNEALSVRLFLASQLRPKGIVAASTTKVKRKKVRESFMNRNCLQRNVRGAGSVVERMRGVVENALALFTLKILENRRRPDLIDIQSVLLGSILGKNRNSTSLSMVACSSVTMSTMIGVSSDLFGATNEIEVA